MVAILISILICILAVYGLGVMLYTVNTNTKLRVQDNITNMKLILVVKNQEENIEGAVRCILSDELLNKAFISGKLTVLDLGSDDDTRSILEKLMEDYNCLEVLDADRKEEVFELPY